jgi:hypothetical protein
MALEVETRTGAAHGEHPPEWLTRRNGNRHRDWQTRVGTMEMRIPRLARASKSEAQTRRLLALASIYEGASRSEAAKIAGVTLQTVRDPAVRCKTEGPDGLIDRTDAAFQRGAAGGAGSGGGERPDI